MNKPLNLKFDVKTLEISNFNGYLTRIKNGTLDSGLAKFSSSFGYDPFSNPGQLTWLEAPVDLDAAGSTVTDLIVAYKTRFEVNTTYVYALGSSGRLYKIQPNSVGNANLDSITVLATLSVNSPSFVFGGSLEFFGATEKIYIGCDSQVNTINFDGSGEATVGSVGSYVANRFRPLKQFAGKLFFGDGANIGSIDSTGTPTFNVLTPGLPVGTYIQDIDVSPDYVYLVITSSSILNEQVATVAADTLNASGGDGYIFKWNGTDKGITSATQIPSFSATALQTFFTSQYSFSNDSFGSAVNDISKKILTLNGNKSPFANAVISNGNFLSWTTTEVVGSVTKASLYYFGNLDNQSKAGLYRLFQASSTQSNGFIYQVPSNTLVNNKYSAINNIVTTLNVIGYGKHYFSTLDVNSSTTKYKLFRFLVTPSGSGTLQAGVYETQNQLFSKRISIQEIRVYTDPTASGNGFQLDMIGANGSVITNGSFSYAYAAGSDITLLQGALERINFNPNTLDLYSLGIRLTNTGTVNMKINKVEIDYVVSGK